MEPLTKEAYYEATWNTVSAIAHEEYGMSKRDAAIYAWIIFGRLIAKDYEKLEH